jgi:hypothetical protein
LVIEGYVQTSNGRELKWHYKTNSDGSSGKRKPEDLPELSGRKPKKSKKTKKQYKNGYLNF